MTDDRDLPDPPQPSREKPPGDDDVIRIEDLAPPTDVRGGRKILLGEILTPPHSQRAIPDS
jgi:hypothetical protein